MFRPDDIDGYLVSYLECLAHEIDLAATFDRSTMIVHERVQLRTFEVLGKKLGCDLSGAYACYNPIFQAQRHVAPAGLSADHLQLAERYYVRLCELFENPVLECPSKAGLDRIRRDLDIDLKRLTGARQVRQTDHREESEMLVTR
jgi:hypothetical protein